ncbi:MAG: hypothetical protein ACK4Q5_20705 [Saprospiraceae bacterium]
MPAKTCLEKIRGLLEADAECFDGKLSAEENGRKFVIERPKASKEFFCRVKIDGCVVPKEADVERCDYLFHRCETGDVYFVELKGKDVEKGIAQIAASVAMLRPILQFGKEQIFGFVIVSRNPIRSAEMQVLGNEFRKKIGAKLEVHSREWTHKI